MLKGLLDAAFGSSREGGLSKRLLIGLAGELMFEMTGIDLLTLSNCALVVVGALMMPRSVPREGFWSTPRRRGVVGNVDVEGVGFGGVGIPLMDVCGVWNPPSLDLVRWMRPELAPVSHTGSRFEECLS